MDPEFFSKASFLLASLVAMGTGVVSFVSPCVLPLLPSFLGYITGTAVKPGMAVNRWNTFLHTLAFVLGFSLIFVVVVSRLGLLFNLITGPATWLSGWPAQVLAWPDRPPITYLEFVQKLGGLFLVVFGLHTAGVLHLGFLDMEKKLNVQVNRRWGYLSSLLIGLVFAVGWTPCITGPLTAILFVGSQSAARMTWFLALYSLGLGVPFLLAGIFLDRVTPVVRAMQRHRKAIAIISGVLLILIGLAVFFGRVRVLSQWLQ